MSDTSAVHKVIDNIILPKFPFIKDVKVEYGKLFGSKIIEVTYVIETYENKEFTVTENFAKIEELTNTLFKMLGLGEDKGLIVGFKTK
jgi:hypothetical protein